MKRLEELKNVETIRDKEISNIKDLLNKVKNMQLSSKKFIEIVEGLRGKSVRGVKTQIAFFFGRVHNFFVEHTRAFLQRIKKSKTVEEKDKPYILAKLTEQEVLTGKFSRLKNAYDYHPLIARKPTIKESYAFKHIFKDFVGKNPDNKPRGRFPGGKTMGYIEGIV